MMSCSTSSHKCIMSCFDWEIYWNNWYIDFYLFSHIETQVIISKWTLPGIVLFLSLYTLANVNALIWNIELFVKDIEAAWAHLSNAVDLMLYIIIWCCMHCSIVLHAQVNPGSGGTCPTHYCSLGLMFLPSPMLLIIQMLNSKG